MSCTSATACTAVGYFQAAANVSAVTLAERWNGKKWAIESTPNPVPDGQFSAVSCGSAHACTAVGTYFAEAWNGHTWAAQSIPAPSGTADSFLFGVSCTAPAACTAAGEAGLSGVPLAVAWNGKKWAIQPPAHPAAFNSEFKSVSCTSATRCTAAGGYVAASENVRTLIEVRR